MTSTPTIPSRDAIVEALLDALRLVRDRDKALLDAGVAERALVHRLAVYLERDPLFDGWNVDCEYNRVGRDSPKSLEAALMRKIQQRGLSYETLEERQKKGWSLVTPDLLVHVRGSSRRNLLALEAKRDGTSPDALDLVKLGGFRSEARYRYRHTAFVSFDPPTLWFDPDESLRSKWVVASSPLRMRLPRS